MEQLFLIFEGGVAWSGICFALGYYIAHRGLVGVTSDLSDVKTDVANLKVQVSGQKTTTPSTTA